MKKPMKLKTRMRWLTFGMVALAVLLNTTIIVMYIFGSLKNNAFQSVRSVSQQTLITFDNLLDSFDTMSQLPLMDNEIFEILNKDYDACEGNTKKFQMYKDMDTVAAKLYMEMFYKNNYVYSVTIIPFNTDLIYSKQRYSRPVKAENVKERPWLLEVCQTSGRKTVLLPQMTDDLYSGEETIISIARLLNNPMKEKDLGVMRIDVAVKDLETIWNLKNLPEGSEAMVVDEAGGLLYTSLENRGEASQILGAMQNHPGDEFSVKLGKVRHMAVASRSEQSGVQMLTLVPQEVIYADAYGTLKILVGVGLLCVLLALVMTEFSTRGIMQPIGELNRLMKKARTGDLSVRSQVEPGGEFEEVCESFNLMIENTQSLIERVYKEQEEKQEMEFRALQAQISPHFTLNTINAIKWMACLQGSKPIENALDSLMNILTFAVREKAEKITIDTELKQMEYYVHILSLRYFNKFDIRFEVEDSVRSCYTLKYMTQTVVENSVFHGFDEVNRRGEIRVRIYGDADRIYYEIWDNGKGMSRERIQEVLTEDNRKENGVNKIGIYNISRRIKLIFGEDYGISIDSEKGRFTRVSIVIPREEANEENLDSR